MNDLTEGEGYEQEKHEDMERWQRFKLTGRAIPYEAVDAWLATWGRDDEPAQALLLKFWIEKIESGSVGVIDMDEAKREALRLCELDKGYTK